MADTDIADVASLEILDFILEDGRSIGTRIVPLKFDCCLRVVRLVEPTWESREAGRNHSR